MPPKKKTKVDPEDGASVLADTEEKPAAKRGRKKAEGAATSSSGDTGKAGLTKVLLNQTTTEFHNQDFTSTAATTDGKTWNLKVSSWNVDGIRAWIKKGGMEYLAKEEPDILCLQETKCSDSKLPPEAQKVKGFHDYWCHSDQEGYAGLGLYTKVKPISVQCGIGSNDFDKEGRLMVAEFKQFYLINVYVPNAGRKLVTLPKRMQWDPLFRQFVKDLDSKKPVIICGDMNVAHQEIDIANPKSNRRNAGFTQEERDGFTTLLEADNLIDCFRHLNPEAKGAYTFWTYLSNARKKNIGWRLDYCLLSEKLSSGLCDCVMRSEVYGSDHCPVVLFLHV